MKIAAFIAITILYITFGSMAQAHEKHEYSKHGHSHQPTPTQAPAPTSAPIVITIPAPTPTPSTPPTETNIVNNNTNTVIVQPVPVIIPDADTPAPPTEAADKVTDVGAGKSVIGIFDIQQRLDGAGNPVLVISRNSVAAQILDKNNNWRRVPAEAQKAAKFLRKFGLH